MHNLKLSFVKRLIDTSTQLSLFAVLLFTSTQLYALGLGNFVVDSNLDQPLNGTIELRVSPGDDLSSLKASVASRDEFNNLGVEYSDYVDDIELSLNTDGVPTISVSSQDEVIKEPFIHFLIKVDWSGGSFLREYTALIDPPVYAAETPKSIAAPRTVGVDQSFQNEQPQDIVVEEIEDTVVEEIDDADVINDVISDEPSIEEPFVDDEYYQPEVAQGTFSQDADSQSTSEFDLSSSTDARYGPVESGESLSIIAQGLQQQFPSLSIYQIMQVLLEENPQAFINGNINGLISGSVLNLSDINVVRQIDLAQSRAFYQQQISDWDPSYLVSSADTIKVGQNEYEYDSSFSDDELSSNDATADISDNFQVGSSTDTETFVSSAQGDSNQGEVLALREEISDLETSLASSALENQELNERISILEGQLADMNRVMNLGVEDAELASLEATLAEQNQRNDAVDESSLNRDGSLDADGSLIDADGSLIDADGSLIDADGSLVDADGSLIDADGSLVDADGSLVDADGSLVDADGSLVDADGSLVDADGSLVDADGSLVDADGSLIDADGSSSLAEPIVDTDVVAFQSKDKSWIDSLKASVFDSGLWRIFAAVVGFLAIGLGLLMYRRRRVDEEFEVSMLSIESNSQSMESSAQSVRSTTLDSGSEAIPGEVDKETSFLTVYSDSDAVVQADEVDPIAEADVYIAYGRDEQAEEVLLDGLSGSPGRSDIKIKLMGLYHKNQNVESFERLSEELYAERENLDPQSWQQVCEMGKDIAPNNPLYDLSSSDISVVDSISTEDENATDVQDAAQGIGDVELSVDDAGSEQETEIQIDAADAEDFVEVYSTDEIEIASDLQIDNTIDDYSDDDLTITMADDSDVDQLVNFDEGRSEISELDQVEIDALDLQSDATDIVDVDSSEELQQDDIEFSLGDDDDDDDDDDQEVFGEVQEVSDLEIDDDYDEARTQYELAKVFVDLGDEDGARKILNDIIDNKANSDLVIKDSRELLDSII